MRDLEGPHKWNYLGISFNLTLALSGGDKNMRLEIDIIGGGLLNLNNSFQRDLCVNGLYNLHEPDR